MTFWHRISGLIVCYLVAHSQPGFAQTGYPFGRVFTTPEQRQQLDLYRDTGVLGADAAPQQADTFVESTAAPASDRLRFSGYMTHSNGSEMIWVDSRSELSGGVSGSNGVAHGKVQSDGGSVQFRARSNQANLKPGQLWLLNEDEVVEVFDSSDVVAAPVEHDANPDSK